MKNRVFRAELRTGDVLAMLPSAIRSAYPQYAARDICDLVDGGIAVIDIEGPLEHKSFWWTSYESVLCQFQSAILDPDVRAVVLKIDSPGGDASGLNATVDIMRALKSKSGKPVIAYADESAYSAAYALACVADEIWIPEAAGVGSIGVISQIVDQTKRDEREGFRVETVTSGKRKADGNPHSPITDAALAHVQRRVDSLATLFFGLVADAREMTPKAVAALEADTFYGSEAVAKGLADGVASFADVLEALRTALDNTASAASKNRGQRPPVGESDMKLIDAARAVNEAQKALDKAKGERAKKLAAKTLARAHARLAKASSEEDEKRCEEESDESETGSTMGSEATESTGPESTGAESEEEESASTGLYTKDRLARLCRQITGKESLRDVMGALSGLHEGAKTTKQLALKVAKLEKADRAGRIEKFITQGKAERKITPGNEARLREEALTHGSSWLSSWLETAQAAVHTTEFAPAEKGVDASGATAEQLKIWTGLGFSPQDIPALVAEQKRAESARKGN